MTAERQTTERLREALERTLAGYKALLAQKPVRDATETIAEAERALAAAPVDRDGLREALDAYDAEARDGSGLTQLLDAAHDLAAAVRAALSAPEPKDRPTREVEGRDGVRHVVWDITSEDSR